MGCSGASRVRVRAAGVCDRVAHAGSLRGRLFVRRDLIHWVIEGGASFLGGAVVRISAIRLALVVSHPIQYFVPLYRRLARRSDMILKVFFTWHVGKAAVEDRGFKQAVSWDIPMTEGYPFELVPNISHRPGTHRFLGLHNPALVERVTAWKPDVVQVTGWAWLSHLQALHALQRPTLFRGDSHLLDGKPSGMHGRIKRRLLQRVFSWPAGFLAVGSANAEYYKYFGVDASRLYPCVHSIDVERFAEPADALEQQARDWRARLEIRSEQKVLLFAGKFEA